MNKDSRRVSLGAWLASLLVAASPAAAQTWTGAGADSNWSTGANWSGGVAPASSVVTQLTFPVGPLPNRSPVVDAPWTINQLTIDAGGYTISGRAITLSGVAPRINLSGGGFNTVSNSIVLGVPTFIGGNGSSLTLAGPISGPGSLTFTGNGGTLLASTSTFTGGVTVGGGALLGFAGSMPGPVAVMDGSIFGGSGTITGSVTVSGLNAGFNLSAPLSTGGVTVTAGNFVGVAINGRGPGQFGSVTVNGTVDVSGARLNLAGTYTPVPGDVFTFIVNDGVDPVVGTFAGMPEGATVNFNGVPLRISYIGGTGNDVTLSAVGATDTRQVPTLSEWALILLASMLLAIGMRRAKN